MVSDTIRRGQVPVGRSWVRPPTVVLWIAATWPVSKLPRGRCRSPESSRAHASGNARQLQNDSASKSRSEEHTSELQSLMRISYAVFCLKKKKKKARTKT